MKILQVVSSIACESSGPSYSVPGLCEGLKSQGVSVELAALGPKPDKNISFQAVYYPWEGRSLRRLGYSFTMFQGLCESVKGVDIVHTNGAWMFPNVYPAKAVKCMGEGVRPKLVTAPRGCFANWAWKRGWLKKHLFGWFCGQFEAFKGTDMWHATCDKEYREIRALGFRQPVAIVPIGIDEPKIDGLRNKSLSSRSLRRKLVFFGRIHKVKGCDKLMYAWAQLYRKLPDWDVVVAGPDNGGLSDVKRIVDDQGLPRVSFVGELHGDDKYRFLADADLYVLPTETENFGVTVAEALAVGTPVVTTKGTLWSGLVTTNSGWWIDNTVEELRRAIMEAAEMPLEALQKMGLNGQEWIRKDFTWSGVGEKMKLAYEWLLDKDRVSQPDWVMVD